MATEIRLRNGTGSGNPTLAAGEPAFKTNTGEIRIGDGATALDSLAETNRFLSRALLDLRYQRAYPVPAPIASFADAQDGSISVQGTDSVARRVLLMPDAVDSLFSIEIPLPVLKSATLRVQAVLMNLSSNSGDINLRFGWETRTKTEAGTSITALTPFNHTVAGLRERQVVESANQNVTASDEIASFYIQRRAAAAPTEDTLSGDVGVVAMSLIEI